MNDKTTIIADLRAIDRMSTLYNMSVSKKRLSNGDYSTDTRRAFAKREIA
jgi:hypothetical protein